MADIKETSEVSPVADVGAETKSPVAPTEHGASWDVNNGPVPRPAGWRYKGFKIGKTELWYASPKVQLLMVSMVCFLVRFYAFRPTSFFFGAPPAADQSFSVQVYSTP